MVIKDTVGYSQMDYWVCITSLLLSCYHHCSLICALWIAFHIQSSKISRIGVDIVFHFQVVIHRLWQCLRI